MLHARKMNAVTADKNINDFRVDFFFMILLPISMVFLIILISLIYDIPQWVDMLVNFFQHNAVNGEPWTSCKS